MNCRDGTHIEDGTRSEGCGKAVLQIYCTRSSYITVIPEYKATFGKILTLLTAYKKCLATIAIYTPEYYYSMEYIFILFLHSLLQVAILPLSQAMDSTLHRPPATTPSTEGTIALVTIFFADFFFFPLPPTPFYSIARANQGHGNANRRDYSGGNDDSFYVTIDDGERKWVSTGSGCVRDTSAQYI